MFHLVSVSPWPLLCSFSVFFFLLGNLNLLILSEINLLMMSIIFLILVLFQWWRDVVREGSYQGVHSTGVVDGLKFGMLLFIISELMFFVSFFWTYFHMFLSPSMEVGLVCPAYMIVMFNPYNIPLLNTLILLFSGMTITWCHHCLMNNNMFKCVISMGVTIMLGILFSYFQYLEYYESYFSISDSVYGSIFFMATGFHGLHVLVGTFFIFVNFVRVNFYHFSMYHHFGFEAASWYWHFVDVVWLFLYVFIYWLSYYLYNKMNMFNF
uniref:Cytochrome c oxidase subunit 3 n=1 Tax=Dinocampus coccinellae TaxID=144245 RepID=A0A343YVC7_9HYME|nr:cytochrome c oxidase subunit 3 [Dinocampus coccinellae]